MHGSQHKASERSALGGLDRSALLGTPATSEGRRPERPRLRPKAGRPGVSLASFRSRPHSICVAAGHQARDSRMRSQDVSNSAATAMVRSVWPTLNPPSSALGREWSRPEVVCAPSETHPFRRAPGEGV